MDKIQELTVGQPIRARNSKGEWSDGTIVTISNSKYTIRWNDNNTEEEITPDAINSGRASAKWIPFTSTSTATTRRRFSTEASPPVFGTYRSSKQYSPVDLSIEESAHISSSEQTPTSPRSAAENQSSASSNNSEPTSVSSISTSENSAKSPRATDQTVKKKTSSKRLKPTKVTADTEKNSTVNIEGNKTTEVDTKDKPTADLPSTDVSEPTPKDKSVKRSSSKRNSGKRKDGITRGESKVKGTDAVTPATAEVDSPKTEPKVESKPKKNDSSVAKGESKVKIKLPVENIDNEVKSPKGDKPPKSPKSSRKTTLDESGSSKSGSKSPRDGDSKAEIKSPRGEKAPKSSRKSEDKPSADLENSSSVDTKDKQSKRKSEKRKSDKSKTEKNTKVKGSEGQKTGEVLSPRGETTKQKSPDEKRKPSGNNETKADVKTEPKADVKTEIKTDSKVDVKAEVKTETSAQEQAEKPVENVKTEEKPTETKPVVPPGAAKPKAAGAKKLLGPKMPVLKPPSQAYIPRPADEALISPRSAAAKKQQAPSETGPKSPMTSPRDAPSTPNPKSPPTSPRESGPAKVGAAKLAGPSREGSPMRVAPAGAVKKVPSAHVKVALTADASTKPEVTVPKESVQVDSSSSTSSSMEISNVVVKVESNSNSSAQEQPLKTDSSSVSGAEPEKVLTTITVDVPTPTNAEPVAESAPKSPRSPKGDVFVLEWSFNQTERNVHMAVGKKGTSVNWRNEEWGLAKGIAPLTNQKQFIEVVRVKGKSQQFQIGICKEDVRVEQSYKNSVISPNIIPGTWETIKVRRSKAGDVIGLLIDMQEKMLTLFVNGSPEQEASFANKHEWGTADPIVNPIFPFFCIHGDLELQISPVCQVEKYKAINWAHGDKQQLPTSNRKMSQATEFFDELGLSKYRSYLDKEVDLKTITEADLKKLNIPLVPRKRILDALEKDKETKN